MRTIFTRVAVGAAIVAGIAVGAPGPAQAIAHGEDAAAGQYGFSVRLSMTGLPAADHGSRDSSCSGALVAPRWVITAGHCFRDAAGKRVGRTVAERTTATIGRTGLADRTGHEVDVVAVHQSETADAALAELDEAVTDIEPLRIATTPAAPGETVRLTGWGLTSYDEGDTVDRLQTGEFVVTGLGETTVSVAGRAPRADTSACPHDSGGPYFRTRADGVPELVAVVSRGPACPHIGDDVAARADNLTGWVSDTMAGRVLGLTRNWWIAVLLAVAGLVAAAAVVVLRRRSRGGPLAEGRLTAVGGQDQPPR